jgi:glyoxylase-like metal-dependent hydrolase (beta-lactamase superfamily II)
VTLRDETVVERSHSRAADPVHGIRIETGSFGPWETNAYLVWDGRSPQALILDPGMGAAAPLAARVVEAGLDLHVIADSHGHIDHVFDNAELHETTGAPIAIHPDDAYRLVGHNSYGFEVRASTAERDLRDGEEVRVGELAFRVLHTPGHTEGSVCLYEPRRALLLAGDTLFPSGWGRTDLPGGDEAQMIASFARLAAQIPPEVRVLPGHGPETRMARELPWLRRVAATGRLVAPG